VTETSHFPKGAVETCRTDHPPNENKYLNDEAVLWNRSKHLMGTRLLPSSDDSDNFFSGTLLGTSG
jgi:hypothetical protein